MAASKGAGHVRNRYLTRQFIRQIRPKMRPQAQDRPGPLLRVAFDVETLFQSGFAGDRSDVGAYMAHQRSMQDVPMTPNPALSLAIGLMGLNRFMDVRSTLPEGRRSFVDLHIASRTGQPGLQRLHTTVKHFGMERIFRECQPKAHYTTGNTFIPVLMVEGGVDVFFSADAPLVRELLSFEGFPLPTAYVAPFFGDYQYDAELIRSALTIAFDWDSVVVDDANDEMTLDGGLTAAFVQESTLRDVVHGRGPHYRFLRALMGLRHWFPEQGDESPFRLALVTSRSMPNFERMSTTLKDLGGEFDRLELTNGGPKGETLQAIGASFFLDDHAGNVATAQTFNIPVGHVIWGPHNDSLDLGQSADNGTQQAARTVLRAVNGG